MHRKAVSIFIFLLSFTIHGQDQYPLTGTQRVDLKGEITAEQPIQYQELFVEIRDDTRGKSDRVAVMPDGRFQIYSVECGNYKFHVLTQHGDLLKEEYISVSPTTASNLEIRLKTEARKAAPAAPISFRRLSHKPDKQAVKSWKQARKHAQKGDHKGAVVYLEKSVSTDPEYFDAHFHLGGQKMVLGDFEGALSSYEKALEIDPLFSPALVSRAMILLHFRRAQEAEQLARKALQVVDSESAHYVLGMSLAAQGANLPDAIEHLKLAEPRHPQAAKTLSFLQGKVKQQSMKPMAHGLLSK